MNCSKLASLRRFPVVAALLFLSFSACSFGQVKGDDRYMVVSRLLVDEFSRKHYNPPRLDSIFSSNLFKSYLQRVDPERKYLTLSDIEGLRPWQGRLVGDFQAGRPGFPDAVHVLLSQRVGEARALVPELLAAPFDFAKEESLETDNEKRGFPTNAEDRRELWRLLLKHRVLTRLIPALNESNAAGKPIAELEGEARKNVEKNILKSLERLSKEKVEDRRSAYLDTFCKLHDPHSDYMTPEESSGFKIDMSGTLEGIGAQLSEEDGYVKVAGIIPGSPSYRGKELQPGDQILKVAQGPAEPVDIVGWRVGDAVGLIRGPKGSEVRLTVKKPDGRVAVIAIIRDVIILDETYAKSAIYRFSGSDERWGYINLPKFYADQDYQKRSSSSDVKRELIKLQALGVKGILLDLRNNGGGYLDDAVIMSGLFFPQGPVVQVRSRGGRGPSYFDRDPDTVYGGPLVVMVNAFSASASEIVAAALQDYGRAVVVGGDHTFGKGTVQSILSLDRELGLDRRSGAQSFGDIKITQQKFYRINGGTTQYRGVVPDVILPDPFAYLDITEKSMEFSLPDDTWERLPYVRWAPSWSRQDLIERSKTRLEGDPSFAKVRAYTKLLEVQKKKTLVPLDLASARKEQARSAEENKKFREIKPLAAPRVEPVDRYDGLEAELRAKKESIQKEWTTQLAGDLFLDEGMRVLQDMANPR
jgi:carboxyl-terminal processing protease